MDLFIPFILFLILIQSADVWTLLGDPHSSGENVPYFPLNSRSSKSTVRRLNTQNKIRNGSQWNSNYPAYCRSSYVSTYKRNGNDKLTKILIVGGESEDSLLSSTWTYTPWTNSWFEIPDGPQMLPKLAAIGFEVLPALCDVYIILIYNLENVWLFDGRTETWSRVNTNSPFADTPKPVSIFYTGSIIINQSKCRDSECTCSGTVWFYGSVFLPARRNWGAEIASFTLELRCDNSQQTEMVCKWEKYNPEIDLPYSRYGQIAVSNGDGDAVYFAARGFTDYYYNSIDVLPISKITPGKFTVYEYNMTDIDKVSCNTNSIVVWRDVLLLTYDFRNVLAMSLNNESQYKWLKFESMSLPKPGEILWQMIETETSSSIVRIHWETNHSPVSVSVYTADSSVATDRRWPQFVKAEKSLPIVSPASLRGHLSLYDYYSHTFYLYGGTLLDNQKGPEKLSSSRSKGGKEFKSSSGSNIWTLTMPSNTWWLIQPETTPGAYIATCGAMSGSDVIIFGGTYENGLVGDELWMYDTELRLWSQIIKSDEIDPWPEARAGCSLAGNATRRTFFLLGGHSNTGKALSDVWVLRLEDGKAVWQDRTSHMVASDRKLLPTARFGHSTLFMHDNVVLYGGRHSSNGDCLFDVWILNVSSSMWSQLPSVNEQYKAVSANKPGASCRSFIAPYGTSKTIVLQNDHNKNRCSTASISLWMIDGVSGNTTLLPSPNRSTTLLAAGLWNGRLIYYGENIKRGRLKKDGLMSIGRNCSPGAAQIDGPYDGPCRRCPRGTYYFEYLGVGECIKCPKGTTTNKPGMKSVTSCTCDTNFCKHGSCSTNADSGEAFRATCVCSFGFRGERCNEISSIVFVLATVTPLSAVLIVAALFYCAVKTLRHRRARKSAEIELEETRRAFTIQPAEIDIVCRLDENCPGGYGQVHKATYRDWTVAVKQLHLYMTEWSDIRQDFLREIQFMRTVRHPNIVMFMGAGQYDTNRPFLVLEFMGGGALRTLLDNKNVGITKKHQLQFSLDAANGMTYLHTLEPPRIHRDLKSANLLLSLNWQVKVADFGSARLIPRLESRLVTKTTRRESSGNKEKTDSLSRRLLNENSYLTSKFIGTSRWRSPEVWRKKSYGKATDVYSFALVLWEILTRQIPFSGSEYKFDASVESAVLEGTRPSIPSNTAEGFRSLIEECWQERPESRPQFESIVTRLKSMNEVYGKVN